MADAQTDIPEGFAPTSTDEVLTKRDGALGRILLNRPRAINALSTAMVDAVAETLETWKDDDSVTAITIEGAGERGLCAGGDVRGVREAFLNGEESKAEEFFTHEYRMNSMMASYPKLIVAYQDGIVMGGGIGISVFCGYRIATTRTKMAMPETIIGFFPDVGALYLLSRMPGGIGAYVSATGDTFNGFDAAYTGFSDIVIEPDEWGTVLEKLASGEVKSADDAASAFASLAVEGTPSLEETRTWVDEAFGPSGDPRNGADIVKSLEASDNEDARAAAKTIAGRSPISVAVTLEALRRASKMISVDEVLAQDLVIARNLMTDGDFVEGVRAQLVDKDRSPKWPDASLADISDARVEKIFEQ